MEFDIENYKDTPNESFAMHCETREEAEEFLEFLHSLGRKWVDGVTYKDVNSWSSYKHNTVYFFNKGTFANLSYAERNGATILEWGDCNNSQSELEPMTFDEICTALGYKIDIRK